jgi:lipopolysaccharide transport system permease protein
MVFFAIKGIFPISVGLHTLLLPLIVVIMAGMGLGLGIIVSSLTTKYRDFNILVTFGVQLLMYVTPVAYPLAYAQAKRPGLYQFLRLNPLAPLVEAFRYSVFGTGSLDVWLLLYSTLFTAIALLAGIMVFNRVERSFMDTV